MYIQPTTQLVDFARNYKVGNTNKIEVGEALTSWIELCTKYEKKYENARNMHHLISRKIPVDLTLIKMRV